MTSQPTNTNTSITIDPGNFPLPDTIVVAIDPRSPLGNLATAFHFDSLLAQASDSITPSGQHNPQGNNGRLTTPQQWGDKNPKTTNTKSNFSYPSHTGWTLHKNVHQTRDG